MVIDIESDAESGLATDVDPPSPLPPLPASPSGSVVYEPLSPSVGAVFVPPPGFSGPGYAGVDSPALASPAFVPPGWGVSSPDPVPVLPPVPPSLLAPPNFWAPDFDHRTLTGCIGLPAPGYDLVRKQCPPPPPEPVPSSAPVPPDGSPLVPNNVLPATPPFTAFPPEVDKPFGYVHVFQEGRWQQAYP